MKTLSESAIVRAFAEQAAQSIARRVIRDLQRMTEHLSGEDSGLETTWDEICVQVQYEHSAVWEAYDATVRALVDGLVEELSPHAQQALWLQTDEGLVWSCEEPDDREDNPVIPDQITDYLLKDYIYAAAGRWSNSRIRAYIDRAAMRD